MRCLALSKTAILKVAHGGRLWRWTALVLPRGQTLVARLAKFGVGAYLVDLLLTEIVAELLACPTGRHHVDDGCGSARG